ncbi:MAG: 30S ribosomal protein S3 [Candidatus Omnitrophica bacterium]|nr:30S ribosomal protein S3 [Candidatus Omnitrophota bacterium]
MGQKVSPLIQRIGYTKDWKSRWFVSVRKYSVNIWEDYQIRKFIKSRLIHAAINEIIIERLSERVKIKIFTARPGIVIGRRGQDIERLREDLNNLIKNEVSIDIVEIKQPRLCAQLVGENLCFQLEKRVAFRRAIKRAIEEVRASGAEGVRISVAGRLGGAEIARRETYREGKIPLSTLRADIDYGYAQAQTAYGSIGVKVWIYVGTKKS